LSGDCHFKRREEEFKDGDTQSNWITGMIKDENGDLFSQEIVPLRT